MKFLGLETHLGINQAVLFQFHALKFFKLLRFFLKKSTSRNYSHEKAFANGNRGPFALERVELALSFFFSLQTFKNITSKLKKPQNLEKWMPIYKTCYSS